MLKQLSRRRTVAGNCKGLSTTCENTARKGVGKDRPNKSKRQSHDLKACVQAFAWLTADADKLFFQPRPDFWQRMPETCRADIPECFGSFCVPENKLNIWQHQELQPAKHHEFTLPAAGQGAIRRWPRPDSALDPRQGQIRLSQPLA